MVEESGIDREEALFLSIMYSFHAAAMQQMGKIANPFTGKVERDLDAARGTIEVLAMFQNKTKGNLSERERRALNGLITELQLNFVDESKREEAAAEEAPAPEAETAPAPEPTPQAEATAEKEPAAEEAPAPEAGEKPTAKAEAEAEPAEAEKPAEEKPKKKPARKRGGAKKKKKKEE
jgi:hypothetical protein